MANPPPCLFGQGWGGHQTYIDRDALVQLLSHLLLIPAKSDLEVFLRDRQFGIGTPQGGLAMTIVLKVHLADNPTHVMACLDFKMLLAPSTGPPA